ncbi:MAG: hypothetical protein H6765_04815 [Candidatus Peribacteria bacterium]|nr:MAG: hypothetical protein H6765_04815 [Candidatus Peribacteria bacterium]
MVVQNYYPTSSAQYARLYYVESGKLKEVDITISFIDYEEIINEEYRWAYEQIDELLDDMVVLDGDDVGKFYRDLLINLRASL